jgi:lysophospholipase L1-like esterase
MILKFSFMRNISFGHSAGKFWKASVLSALVCCVLAANQQAALAYPLSEEEAASLKAAMPRTLARLEARQPVNVLIIGDSVSRVFTPTADANQTVHGMHAQFVMRLCNEFFYPGGARVIGPLEGEPSKREDSKGSEIFLENLALSGHTAIDGLQRMTTDAFLHEPDLVMISYGINEAVRDFDLGTYQAALEQCIDICQARKVDVMLLGPSIIRQSPGPTGWGLTRAHATKAREIAAAKNVFFVDLGMGLSERGGLPFKKGEGEAKKAITEISKRLVTIFDHGPDAIAEDWLHPNHTSHTAMGDHIYDTLMKVDKGDSSPLKFTASGSSFQKDGRLRVDLTLANTGKTRRRGHFAGLTMRRQLSPTEVYRSFDLKPGQSRAYTIVYARVPKPGQEELETPAEFYHLDPADSKLRLSYLVVDEQQSGLVDLVTPLLPIGVEWNTTLLTNVTDQIRVEWTLVNKSSKAQNVRYKIVSGRQSIDGSVQLDQGQSGRRYANIKFTPRPGVIRQKLPLKLVVDVAGRSTEFAREIEMTRDLFLGERIALSNSDDYLNKAVGSAELGAGASGVTLRADADEKALYLTFDFEGMKLQPLAKGASLIADLSIDGRPSAEVRSLGCVDRVRILAGAEAGYGETNNMRPGFFGNGYAKKVDARYIISTIEERADLSQRFTVKIPRKYLFLHEWDLGNADSVVGLNTTLSLATIDPATGAIGFPGSHRYLLANSGYYFRDARSLITLRLTPDRIPTWSARIY